LNTSNTSAKDKMPKQIAVIGTLDTQENHIETKD
jgi:hypothetical protein